MDLSLPSENRFRPAPSGGRRSPPYFLQGEETNFHDQYPQLVFRSSSAENSPSPPLPASSFPAARAFPDYSTEWSSPSCAADAAEPHTSKLDPLAPHQRAVSGERTSSSSSALYSSSPLYLPRADYVTESFGDEGDVPNDREDNSLPGLGCDDSAAEHVFGTIAPACRPSPSTDFADFSNHGYCNNGNNGVYSCDNRSSGYGTDNQQGEFFLPPEVGLSRRESSHSPSPGRSEDSSRTTPSRSARKKSSGKAFVSEYVPTAPSCSSMMREYREEMLPEVLRTSVTFNSTPPVSSDFPEKSAASNGSASSYSWSFPEGDSDIPRKPSSSRATATHAAAATADDCEFPDKSAAAILAFTTLVDDDSDQDKSSPSSAATASEADADDWFSQGESLLPDCADLTESSPAIFENYVRKSSPPPREAEADVRADLPPHTSPAGRGEGGGGGPDDAASGKPPGAFEDFSPLRVVVGESEPGNVGESDPGDVGGERGGEGRGGGGRALPAFAPPSSLSSGPVSPGGKKRVRISDATSVRVFQEDEEAAVEGGRGAGGDENARTDYQGHVRRERESAEGPYGNLRPYGPTPTGPPRQHRGGGGGGGPGGQRQFGPTSSAGEGGGGGLSPRVRRELRFPEGGCATTTTSSTATGPVVTLSSSSSSGYSSAASAPVSEYRGGSAAGECPEYREKFVTLDQLTFPEDVPPTPPEKSLESRDNPFLPGGDLSNEAEELLKHATIVRDKFYLDKDGRPTPHSPSRASGGGGGSPAKGQHWGDAPDGSPGILLLLPNNGQEDVGGLREERISPAHAGHAEARATNPYPRENGRPAEDGAQREAAAGGGSPFRAAGEKGGAGGGSDNAGSDLTQQQQQQDKDKAKRRPKCCAVM